MSGLSGLGRALVIVCDTVKVMESYAKYCDSTHRQENPLIKKASLISRLVLLGFSLTEAGMLLSGKKSEPLSKLKKMELFIRYFNFSIQFQAESTQSSKNRSWTQVLNNGIFQHFIDFLRIVSEVAIYDEEKYFQMTPQQLALQTKPIYTIQNNKSKLKISGVSQVNLDESKEIVSAAQEFLLRMIYIRAAAEIVHALGKSK